MTSILLHWDGGVQPLPNKIDWTHSIETCDKKEKDNDSRVHGSCVSSVIEQLLL